MSVILDYRTPSRRRQPNPVLVLLLCVPGFLCWCLLLGAFAEVRLPRWMFWLDALPNPKLAFLSLWWAAVFTAFASIVYVYGRPKPWYVVLNLAINIPGLLLTLVLIRPFLAWSSL